MKIHHIGIVVTREEWSEALVERFGGVARGEGYVEEYGADCRFVDFGGTVVEFIFPRTPLLAAHNNGVGGLHHIAFETDDIEETQRALRSDGVTLLEECPVKGAAGIIINFVSPAFFGIPVEIVQKISPGTPGEKSE